MKSLKTRQVFSMKQVGPYTQTESSTTNVVNGKTQTTNTLTIDYTKALSANYSYTPIDANCHTISSSTPFGIQVKVVSNNGSYTLSSTINLQNQEYTDTLGPVSNIWSQSALETFFTDQIEWVSTNLQNQARAFYMDQAPSTNALDSLCCQGGCANNVQDYSGQCSIMDTIYPITPFTCSVSSSVAGALATDVYNKLQTFK